MKKSKTKKEGEKERKKTYGSIKAPRSVLIPRSVVYAWYLHFNKLSKDGKKQLSKEDQGEIPFLRQVYFKNTQVVAMNCRCGSSVLTSTAGSAITAVISPTLAAVLIVTPLTTTWSEYRCRGGRLKYTPAFEGGVITNSGIIAWVVDYATTTALSSYNGAIAYDTMKVKPTFKEIAMEAHTEFAPDEDWLPTTNTSQVFFTFKPYADGTTGIGVSTAYGLLYTELDLEFRGVD